MADGTIGSVIIPAHDEAGVIARCLQALLTDVPDGALQVVVVCNGCRDRSADLARATGLPVRVVEIDVASKIAALRVGDVMATAFPRLYVDADVVLPGSSALAVLGRLSTGEVLAARPELRYDLGGCSWAVRRYYAARSRIPGLFARLWGAGVYGLSERGRARFADWPDITGDDLFVDSLFADDEVEVIRTEPVVVTPPRTARDLLAVLRRGARAKSGEQRGRDGAGGLLPLRQSLSGTLRGLALLAVRRPWTAVDVLVYAGFATYGRLHRGRRSSPVWERDGSSRACDVRN